MSRDLHFLCGGGDNICFWVEPNLLFFVGGTGGGWDKKNDGMGVFLF